MIVEGRSDAALFKVWFEHLQTDIDFLAAEEVIPGGGCTAVAPAVQYSLGQSVPALGIVDRDFLHRMKAWDLLFSRDVADLLNASGDPNVRVIELWEVEAYLLLPELMSTWVGVQRTPQPATHEEKSTALLRAIEECEALLCAAPFFASGHSTGTGYDLRHFKADPADRIAEICREKLEAETPERQAVANQIEAHIAAIRAAAPADPPERLVYLLRYVDTKRLLLRLGHRLNLGADAHHALGVLMADRDLRPTELEALLKEAAIAFEAQRN